MTGKVSYSIEMLEIFAEKLDCSYDYLLGKTTTPDKKLQDMKEMTGLTDEALEILSGYAKERKKNKSYRLYLNTISNLIKQEDAINSIAEYFYINDKVVSKFISGKEEIIEDIKVGTLKLSSIEIEDAYLIRMVRSLKEAKSRMYQIYYYDNEK